jgi:hypothetical protein
VAILREGRVRNGLESKRKASCYCSKLKLGGFVMLGLVVITITPGDSVAKSRLFGAVLAAAAIALMMFVVALVTILRQGHSLLCSLWLSLRATIFDVVFSSVVRSWPHNHAGHLQRPPHRHTVAPSTANFCPSFTRDQPSA